MPLSRTRRVAPPDIWQSPISTRPSLLLDARWSFRGTPVGATIPLWSDLSGTGHDVVQATAANQSTRGFLNNRPAVIFDGANDYLKSASATASTYFDTDNVTVFAAVRQNTQGNNCLLGWSASAAVEIFAAVGGILYWDYGGNGAGQRVSVAQPAGWANTGHMLAVRRGTTQDIYVDGGAALVSGGSPTGTVTGSDGVSIGAYTDGSLPGKYDLGALVMYPAYLSVGDMTAVAQSLAARYGITCAALT